MIYDGEFPIKDITLDSVFTEWMYLSNRQFSAIYEKIRERRKMYRLDWKPNEPGDLKRWRDYVIDPLPRNNVDFKADRLTMRPLLVRVPSDQLDIDSVDVLNRNSAFKNVDPSTDIFALTKRLREMASEMAKKRADTIEKFLNGTLYINQLFRKENLQLRWAMHLLVDGYAAYLAYKDINATDDEYPIILRAIDPLSVVYLRGDQKLEKLLVGRRATVGELRREFGGDLFVGLREHQLVNVIDWWFRVKVRKQNQINGNKTIKAEVYHATYLGTAGVSQDLWSANQYIPNQLSAVNPDKAVPIGWALKPSLTDYFEIPGDVIEARTTPLTETIEEFVASDMDSAQEVWNSRNFFLTRMHKIVKLASGADLVVKGLQGEVLQRIGKGEGITVPIPGDSNINPQDALAFTQPPPFSPNMQMLDVALNAMLQQSLVPITTLGNRGGTVSGAQVDQLDQGAMVRLQAFVNAMNLINTAWCRTVMQIANVFYKTGEEIPVYGIDKTGTPFALTVQAADIQGNFTVFAEINPYTVMEQLQIAMAAANLHQGDPEDRILSAQTIRELFGVQYAYQEEERIKKEAIALNEDIISVQAQRQIAQAQMQILQNLIMMDAQQKMQGINNPMLQQMIMTLQDQVLQAMAWTPQGGGNNSSSGPGPINMGQPTNENAAPGPANPITDNRNQPPTNPSAQRNGMVATGNRNGLILPR